MILALATLAAYLRVCAPAVSADTMRAIVAVESHGYSYAINDNSVRTSYCVPGAHAYPCSRKEATAIAEAAIAQGHSVDVGVAQINSSNFVRYRVNAAEMLHPCSNLRIGSAILTNAYRDSSERFEDQREALWHAIMAYNTGSLYHGQRYVWSVVNAALSTADPTVPSIAILQTVSLAPRDIETKLQPKHLRALRKSQFSETPRNAPLVAQRLRDALGTQSDNLSPVVEHQ